MIVVFRLGSTLVVPGLDIDALNSELAQYEAAAQAGQAGITAMISLMTGGAFQRMAILHSVLDPTLQLQSLLTY